jgi:hypothetical protein
VFIGSSSSAEFHDALSCHIYATAGCLVSFRAVRATRNEGVEELGNDAVAIARRGYYSSRRVEEVSSR